MAENGRRANVETTHGTGNILNSEDYSRGNQNAMLTRVGND